MPRFFGGGGVKIAATLMGFSALSKNLKHIPVASDCEIILHLFEECMSRNSSCDYYRKMMASCGEVKRGPGVQWLVESQKKWEESIQREATAGGFASIKEYMGHKMDKDPEMCRIAYKLYNECLASHTDETKWLCEFKRRNNCPEFK